MSKDNLGLPAGGERIHGHARSAKPSESLHARGHYSNHGQGSVEHDAYHALDHGMSADHMQGRKGNDGAAIEKVGRGKAGKRNGDLR